MHTYACSRFSLHSSFSVVPFISGSYSLCCLFFTLHLSSSCLSVFLSLSLSYFLSRFLSCSRAPRWLFLAGWVWKCAMINMLPWLLILSNGSVKFQCLDKYQRWRNICGAAQRHNEGKQLELIGCNSVRVVVFRHRSKASSILHISAYTVKNQVVGAWSKICSKLNISLIVWVICCCPTVQRGFSLTSLNDKPRVFQLLQGL